MISDWDGFPITNIYHLKLISSKELLSNMLDSQEQVEPVLTMALLIMLVRFVDWNMFEIRI